MKESKSGGASRQDYRKDQHHVDAHHLFLRVVELESENERLKTRAARAEGTPSGVKFWQDKCKRQADVIKEISDLLKHHIGNGVVCINGENHYLSVLVAKALAGPKRGDDG